MSTNPTGSRTLDDSFCATLGEERPPGCRHLLPGHEEEEPGVGPLQVRQGRQDDLLLLQQLGDHFVRLLPVALTVTSEEQKYILYFGRCTPTFTDSANSRPFYASFNDNFILLIYYKTILT